MAKYIVTGGAGFIGSHLAHSLSDGGHEVICIDNFSPYYSRRIKETNTKNFSSLGIKLIELDLAKESITDICKGAEAIIHLAAQPGISSKVLFEDYEGNNIIATHKLLESIKQLDKPPFLIFVSTSSVYGSLAIGDESTPVAPTSYYGVTKLAAEQLALSYYRDKGMPVAVVRPFSVYGERERPEKLYPALIRAIMKDEAFPLFEGSLTHRRSYTYVGDIVDGVILMLGAPEKSVGEIFNLGTEDTHTTEDGIKIIESLMGKKAKFDIRAPRSGDQKETKAVIDKAKKILGYTPHVGLQEGLTREVAWFRANPL